MVENIFKETFNVPISTFETQNLKHENPRSVKINLNDIDEIFREKKANIERETVSEMKKTKSERMPGN